MTDIERCDQEIADADAMLRTGHRDMAGLLHQVMDWSIERRLLTGSAAVQVPGGKLGKRRDTTWA